MAPDGRQTDFLDSHGHHSIDESNSHYKHIIPYDYANIDDYKFVQTPTTPTPASTPGLTERRFGKFNPHLAHIAGLKFRKDSCGSCQKSLQKAASRENAPKEFRYFCRKCRMLHKFEDAIDRSCDSLAYEAEGSTASCLDKKAFCYTPTHIHLAIISSKTYRPTKELLSFKNRHPFKNGPLHNTRSESNLAKSKYSSNKANMSSSQDIFSPNPKRKISDICTHSMEASEAAKILPKSTLSTLYDSKLSEHTLHHKPYRAQPHMMSQMSVDYSSTCSLYSQKDGNLTGSRFFVYPEDSRVSYGPESDVVLSAKPFMSSKKHSKTLIDNAYPSCSSDKSLPRHHQRLQHHHNMPLSPRLPEESNLGNHQPSSSRFPFASSSSSYSFDMAPNESLHSGSLASSVSSVRYSPKSLHHLHQISTLSGDQVFLSRESLHSMPQYSQGLDHQIPSTSQWYSMTSVNTNTLDDYDEEDEDEEDEVTVAEFKSSSVVPKQLSSLPQLTHSDVELATYPTSP